MRASAPAAAALRKTSAQAETARATASDLGPPLHLQAVEGRVVEAAHGEECRQVIVQFRESHGITCRLS